MLKVVLITLLSLALSNSFGQYSARLMVLSGANIPFFFNTLDRLENGLNNQNFPTVLGITLADDDFAVDPVLTGFILTARATTPNIVGYSNTIPLNIIEIQANPVLGGFADGVFVFEQNLPTAISDAPVNLLIYEDLIPNFNPLNANTDRVNIIFRAGENGNGLIGVPGDRYAVDILFELTPTGAGF